MGLDGISVNQLRINSDLNSNELNAQRIADNNNQYVDGLSQGQRVHPDEKKENSNQKNKNSSKSASQDDSENENEDEILESFEGIDLSDAKKYILKVDENTNNILIIDKETQNVVQNFNPESLSNLTKYLTNYTGVLINRKF